MVFEINYCWNISLCALHDVFVASDHHYGRAVILFGIPYVYTQSRILKVSWFMCLYANTVLSFISTELKLKRLLQLISTIMYFCTDQLNLTIPLYLLYLEMNCRRKWNETYQLALALLPLYLGKFECLAVQLTERYCCRHGSSISVISFISGRMTFWRLMRCVMRHSVLVERSVAKPTTASWSLPTRSHLHAVGRLCLVFIQRAPHKQLQAFARGFHPTKSRIQIRLQRCLSIRFPLLLFLSSLFCYLLSLFSLLSFFSFPSFPSFLFSFEFHSTPFPIPFPYTLSPTRWSEKCCKLPQHVPKRSVVHFNLKTALLVIAIYILCAVKKLPPAVFHWVQAAPIRYGDRSFWPWRIFWHYSRRWHKKNTQQTQPVVLFTQATQTATLQR